MAWRFDGLPVVFLAAPIILIGASGVAMNADAHDANSELVWTRRDHVRAFYSGHSLSEGVPEAIAQIAGSLGYRLDFEAQSLGYSLLRERTKGKMPSNSEWTGYGAGRNRTGEGLNVAEELSRPQQIGVGNKYDALVVTERHDLPTIARKERTAFYLADVSKRLLVGNPDAEVLLYHTWLHVDHGAPRPWIDYEREVAPMWECVASRANRDLPARGNAPRIRVLPGGSALAELADALWAGQVPGVEVSDPGARVRLLFSDNVHMSEIGRYFIALVHFGVLFGRSPEGAVLPKPISPEAGRYMQALAWKLVVSYGQRANAAARRDMATCRELMVRDVCPAYVAFRHGEGALAAIRRRFDLYSCQREYAGAEDPENPFNSLKQK